MFEDKKIETHSGAKNVRTKNSDEGSEYKSSWYGRKRRRRRRSGMAFPLRVNGTVACGEKRS